MKQTELKNKKITILGAARSGLAAAQLLKEIGAKPFVSDSAAEADKTQQAQQLRSAKIPFEFGGHSARIFEADLAVLSPGIPLRSKVAQEILSRRIPLYSEIEVASWFCLAPFIAVTGSNGKTTTTTLIGEMLRRRYADAIIAGNIGQPFSEFVLQSHQQTRAVVEVSSFQLETIEHFHPRQAVVLNFAPNHLDRYDSYSDYIDAKWRITKNLLPEDRLIYNVADAALSERSQRLAVQKEGFAINGDRAQAAYFADNIIYLHGQEVIDVREMILRGPHNYMNAMAAALAASNAGVPLKDIRAVLREFPGIEHRLEFVAEKGGVKFINDSKATTVESLAVALQSFGEPIVLIAGGKDKGSDFTKLNDLIREHVKALVLIGKAADKMEAAWQGLSPIHKPQDFPQAVQLARQLAQKGEVVLLSPACASFDMFRDYEDRGRQFKQLVHQL